MTIKSSLAERLRERIVGMLHLGRLHAGDRLPSIREVAQEEGVNARTAAAAYRVLAAEGLVEVRGRSGVYVAKQERVDSQLLPEMARWVSQVLVEARRRRLRVPEFHDFIRRCTALVRVRCACVESVMDAMTSYAAELEEEWGMEVERVFLDLPEGKRREALRRDRLHALRERLRGVDLVATSIFLASAVRPLAEELDKPLVVLTVHPELRAVVQRRLEAGRLDVVAMDPRFGDRIRVAFGEAAAGRVHLLLARDSRAVSELRTDGPVLLTRAAREHLGDAAPSHVIPITPLLDPEADRELATVLIELNRGAW